MSVAKAWEKGTLRRIHRMGKQISPGIRFNEGGPTLGTNGIRTLPPSEGKWCELINQSPIEGEGSTRLTDWRSA